jgi:hypothetical protein
MISDLSARLRMLRDHGTFDGRGSSPDGRTLLSSVFCVSILAVGLLCACASPGSPTYTPIVAPPLGVELPATAISVSVQEILEQPEAFLGEFVEVQGLYRGAKEILDCEGYVTSPDEWILAPVGGPPIGVKNEFDGLLSSPSGPDGRAIRNTMKKKITVWGWVRLYDGPVGCPSTDLNGEPRPVATGQVWYIDAVKAQFLESVHVD